MNLTRLLYHAARVSAWSRAGAKLVQGNPRPILRRVRNRIILKRPDEPEVFACTEADENLDVMDEARAESKARLRRVKEIRANKFAAHLLMPEGLVRDVWREEHGNRDRVAHALMVSKEALGYRLGSLGLS